MTGHAVHIGQHWSHGDIMLSYIISATGSFCTIQLMEQWRQYEKQNIKLFLMALSAFALGGCGIWCTHFTGMNALHLQLDDGTTLEMHYELGMTILSFLFPVFGVFVGLFIASRDPFFLEIEASRRKEILVKQLNKASMKDVVKKDAAVRRIKYAALFSRLWYILFGGLFAALGVLGMHYLGMSAQRSNATIDFNVPIVLVSCVIAFGTATAAFWIIFRALTFWPNFESLRLASALIMGVAVCGTHYTGMGAASYTHNDEDYAAKTLLMVEGTRAAVIASHSSILVCYWLTSLGVTKSVKVTEAMSRSRQDERGSHNQTANTASTIGKKEANRVTRGMTANSSGSGLVAPDRAKVYMETSRSTPQ